MTKHLMQTYQNLEAALAKNKSQIPLEAIFRKDKTIRDRYQIVKQLGRGVFGLVVQARDLQKDGEVVAIKIMPDKTEEGDCRMREQAA